MVRVGPDPPVNGGTDGSITDETTDGLPAPAVRVAAFAGKSKGVSRKNVIGKLCLACSEVLKQGPKRDGGFAMGPPTSTGTYHTARFCPAKMVKIGVNITNVNAVPAGALSDSDWATHCAQKMGKSRKRKVAALSLFGLHEPAAAAAEDQPQLAPPGIVEPVEAEEKYCIPTCTDPGGDMVGCDNDDCTTGGGWFHLQCVGLATTPSESKQWYCPTCEPLMS